MKNLKIRNRLLLGFGIVLILLIFVSIFSGIQMDHLATFTTDLYKYSFTVTNAVRDLEINTSRMHRLLKDILLSENAAEMENAVASINSMEKTVYERLSLVQDRYLGDQEDVDKVRQEFAYWKPIRDEIIALARENEKAAAAALAKGKGMTQIQALNTASETLIASAGKRAVDFMKNAQQSERHSLDNGMVRCTPTGRGNHRHDYQGRSRSPGNRYTGNYRGIGMAKVRPGRDRTGKTGSKTQTRQ